MKKFIVLAALILFVINISAQEKSTDSRTKLYFGAKIGGNLSNVYDTQGETFTANPKAGFATGIFASIPVGKYLGIQPEILFSQRGYKSSGTLFLLGDYGTTHTSNYIDVPLLVVLKPVPFVTLLAGPQISFLLSQRDVFTSGNLTSDQQKQFDNNNLRKNTLCFTGGFDLNFHHMVIGGRAGWDLQNNNGDGTSTAPRYKNVWYQVTAGFRFSL
jgi:hypothetical protein